MAFRIPVYRAQIRATTEAPGRSFNARMSPQAAAQAELAKAAPGAKLITQAAAFADTMYKFEVETKRNEAILGAKEELMRIQDELSKTDNIFDVFKEDGSGLWQTQSQEIKQRLRDTIGRDRYALADFDNSFDQAELSMRYSLKSVIDDKIIKRREAALAARDAQVVAKFSNPFGNFSKEEVAFEVGTLDQMWTRAKANGGVNPNYVGSVNLNNMVQIAENVAMGYAGRDPNLVYALGQNLDILDQLANNQITEDQAKLMAAQLPNGEWALTTLSSIPRDQANEILAGVFTEANKFQRFRDEQDQKTNDFINNQSDVLKLDIFGSEFNKNNSFEFDDLIDRYKNVPGILTELSRRKELAAEVGQTTIDGNEFRSIAADILKRSNKVSLDEAQSLEALINEQRLVLSPSFGIAGEPLGATTAAPENSSPQAITYLTVEAAKGDLDVNTVFNLQSQLSNADFTKYIEQARALEELEKSELQSAFELEKDIIKGELFVIGRDPLQNEDDQIAYQAQNAVITSLLKGIRNGDITTEEQLQEEAARLTAREKRAYIISLKGQVRNVLVSINQIQGPTSFGNTVTLTTRDPLAALEAKKAELIARADQNNDENLKVRIENEFIRIYALLNKYVKRGVFDVIEEPTND